MKNRGLHIVQLAHRITANGKLHQASPESNHLIDSYRAEEIAFEGFVKFEKMFAESIEPRPSYVRKTSSENGLRSQKT